MAIRQLYIKMKNDKGTSVFRNMAPVNTTAKISFAPRAGDELTNAVAIANSFVPVQVEEVDVENGLVTIKEVSETLYTVAASQITTVAGTDAWTDTTEEKLVLDLIDAENNTNPTIKLSKAATAAIGTGNYEDSMKTYANTIVQYYNGYKNNVLTSISWTEEYITGKKEGLRVTND